MANTRLEYLFNGYVKDDLTIDEEQELMTLVRRPEMQGEIKQLVDEFIRNSSEDLEMNSESASSILESIFEKRQAEIVPIVGSRVKLKFWIGVAATVLLFIAGGAVYWSYSGRDASKKLIVKAEKKSTPVQPGGNRTLLTTSDGTVIVLDSLKNGSVLHRGSAIISKQGSTLIYNVSNTAVKATEIIYNTLATPKGRQFEVILPDGSKVWLNAASSLYFPSVFKGKQRVVELTGEAYFEVAKNKAKPFQVNVGDMHVNVLGTHFNVNAYKDENEIKTSLLEGSVKITRRRATRILRPGQQVVLNDENKVEIHKVNMDRVVAWKNGLFQFEGANIRTIMREVSRWYGIEVEFNGKPPDRRFEGKISRSAALEEVLRILELSGVRFKSEGNRIVVN